MVKGELKMKIQKAVALRLSNLLLDRKMTQYSLSIKANLSRQAIANIINEKYTSINLTQ